MSNSIALLIPILLCLCGGILFVALFVGIIFWAYRSGQSSSRAWADVGTRTGLTLKPGSLFSFPELNGEFRQRRIHVYNYRARRTSLTEICLTVNNPGNATLRITPSGTLANFFDNLPSVQRVEIGNPEFDARFVVKSNLPEFAVKVLTDSRVQAGLMDIPHAFRIELEGPSLKYSKNGLEDNTEFMIKTFNTLSDLADRLEAFDQSSSL
jgi:cbb3-type cytochrome oxidase subunit 3